MSSQIKVITYNLLSAKLCNESNFLNYENSEDLDSTIRKTRTIILNLSSACKKYRQIGKELLNYYL
jgi:hypothetical protein